MEQNIIIFVPIFIIFFIVNGIFIVKSIKLAWETGYSMAKLWLLSTVFSGIGVYIWLSEECGDVCRKEIKKEINTEKILRKLRGENDTESQPRPTTWECPHCGRINSARDIMCKDCGSYK